MLLLVCSLKGKGLEKDDINYLVETSGPEWLEPALYERLKIYNNPEEPNF